MSVFPFVVVAWILMVGLYGVVTSRHLVHQIVCLIVVQSSTYVLLLGVGYVTGAVAPYFFDVPDHTPAVDPVVQALALTDVVVEAAGAGGFAAVGVSAVATGLPYLYNFLPLGSTPGAVSSSGTIALISFFVGLEVAAAFILIVGELLEQTLLIRHGSD